MVQLECPRHPIHSGWEIDGGGRGYIFPFSGSLETGTSIPLTDKGLLLSILFNAPLMNMFSVKTEQALALSAILCKFL